MKQAPAILVSLVVIVFSISLASCGGGSNYTTPPPVQTLLITSGALPDGRMGAAYGANSSGFTLAASGGVAPYVWTWSAAAGSSLPPGLNLSGSAISGAPTAKGSFAVVVRVTDSASPPSQTTANSAVNVFDLPSITSGALPDGRAGTSYGATHTLKLLNGSSFNAVFFLLAASGGTGSFPSWNWAAAQGSSLPPGLTCCSHTFSRPGFSQQTVQVNNSIAGKPTQPGTYHLVVTVADSGFPAGQTSVPYTIVIAPPPPPVITTVPLLPIGTLGSPYVGFTFTAPDGLSPLTWSETGALPPGLVFSTAGVLSGTPTAAGLFPITVQVQDSLGQNSAAQALTIQILAKGFAPTGSLADARVQHVAALLTSGKVLITGGTNTNVPPVTAELYDPAAKAFSFTKGTMGTARVSATATVLKSGKVLVIGGNGPDGNPVATAEIYDPASDTFALTTGSMQSTRVYHTATLLNDGTVLVTGGLDVSGNSSGVPVATAELFDPNTTSFTPLANMGTARNFHAATLLANGKVLVTGGFDSGTGLPTAELYDPATKTFSLTIGNMTVGRAGHTATLVSGGKVLVAGGAASLGGAATSTAELFDPATATFSATTGAMSNGRSLHTATLLNNSQVLMAGGDAFFNNGAQAQSLSAAELFDPVTGSFTSTADMTTGRESHTATLLGNGQVLVVGGADSTLGSVLATAELYQ